MADEFLTVAEIAGLLKLNPQTVRNWIDSGKLPAYHIGRRVRVGRQDFDRLVEDSYMGRRQPAGPSIWDARSPNRSCASKRTASRTTTGARSFYRSGYLSYQPGGPEPEEVIWPEPVKSGGASGLVHPSRSRLRRERDGNWLSLSSWPRRKPPSAGAESPALSLRGWAARATAFRRTSRGGRALGVAVSAFCSSGTQVSRGSLRPGVGSRVVGASTPARICVVSADCGAEFASDACAGANLRRFCGLRSGIRFGCLRRHGLGRSTQSNETEAIHARRGSTRGPVVSRKAGAL